MMMMLAVLASPISSVAITTRMLLRRSPPLRPHLLEMMPTREPPIIPPMQKMATIQDQMRVALVTQSCCFSASISVPFPHPIWDLSHSVMIPSGALRTPVLYPCWNEDPMAPAAMARASLGFKPSTMLCCGEETAADDVPESLSGVRLPC